jgi:NADPH:quinone reductase-like Zn-dependent oxidoreductase
MFAAQIAKAFGAEVTGVTSSATRKWSRDYVVDYTKEDFTKGSGL